MENSMTDRRLCLWLSYGAEHFARQADAVLSRFPDLTEAFELAKRGRTEAFSELPDRCVARLMESAEENFLDRWLDKLNQAGIRCVFREDPDYPVLLTQISAPPWALYLRGKLVGEPLLPIGVVGCRAATSYGKDMARTFAYGLVQAGATVISGMACGIDAMAALGALEEQSSDFPTVAVLGSGVDVVYPPENRGLYDRIIERGAVISEFLPGTPPKREHFPIRNRIISGMSKGVLVVEAGERSGASITANDAIEQNREVFVIPGRITDRKSVGTNRLIQRGQAKPVFCLTDILEEFHLPDAAMYDTKTFAADTLYDLSKEEHAIIELLKQGELTFDELSEKLPFSAGLLNSYLTALEFSGIMKQLPGRIYGLNAASLRQIIGKTIHSEV